MTWVDEPRVRKDLMNMVQLFSRTVSAEPRALALMVREDDDATRTELNGLLQTGLDWTRVTELARTNCVSGLIAPKLMSPGLAGRTPQDVATKFRMYALGIAAVSMHMEVELQRLLAIGSAIDVPLIVLKGAAVGNLLYSNPHARQAGDIDLLCRESDYTKLHDALVEAGYTTDDGRLLPGKCSSLETAFEQHFKPAGQNLLIELHVDSMKLGVKPLNSDSVWDRAVPVQIGQAQALSLSPRDLAVMLPVHLHRHGFNRLIWFKDIDLLVRRYGDRIDWDAVVRDARDEGATSSLWLTFDLLPRMLGTRLPDGVLRQLRPPAISRYAWRMIWPRNKVLSLEAVTRRRTVQFSLTESWRGTLPSLVLMGRRREKLRVLLHRLMKPLRRSERVSS